MLFAFRFDAVVDDLAEGRGETVTGVSERLQGLAGLNH